MFHTQAATSLSPALVIYLIDASYSMNDPCGRTTKIDLVHKALQDAVQDVGERMDAIVNTFYAYDGSISS